MRSSRIIGSAMLALVVFQACEKNEAPVVVPTLTEKTVSGIPADTIVGLVNGQPVGAGKYTFFSFETNAVVPSTDSNSVKWDVAVRGTTIITNGGNLYLSTGTSPVATTAPTPKKVPWVSEVSTRADSSHS